MAVLPPSFVLPLIIVNISIPVPPKPVLALQGHDPPIRVGPSDDLARTIIKWVHLVLSSRAATSTDYPIKDRIVHGCPQLLTCGLRLGVRPALDDLLKLRETIGQSGRTRLQDQGRFYLVNVLVLHSPDLLKTWPRHNPLGSEFLAAP